jgi:hypothetical protein
MAGYASIIKSETVLDIDYNVVVSDRLRLRQRVFEKNKYDRTVKASGESPPLSLDRDQSYI